MLLRVAYGISMCSQGILMDIFCFLWENRTDYQVACVALQEAEELCSSNWEEISYLLDRIEILEARLIEAGIPIPE